MVGGVLHRLHAVVQQGTLGLHVVMVRYPVTTIATDGVGWREGWREVAVPHATGMQNTDELRTTHCKNIGNTSMSLF